MTTAVAMWGNSAAIRLPKSILRLASLVPGDEVSITVNERGNIEIAAEKAHRRVLPTQGLSFDSVFSGYTGGRYDASSAWPSEDMAGAEREVWD